MLQRTDLRPDAGAAIHGLDMDAGQVLGEIAKVVCYLQAQFARGAENQGLRLLGFGIDALKDRYAEGGRLACARLGQGNHIVHRSQKVGNHFFLYGHRLHEAQFADGATNRFAHAQFFKCFQKGVFILSTLNFQLQPQAGSQIGRKGSAKRP